MNKLNFLGDVYLPKPFKSEISLEHFIFNLEAPITNQFVNPARNKINLSINKFDNIQKTFNKSPLVVCLSNNHIFDFGEVGFQDTLKVLGEKKIEVFGAGSASSSFNNPLVLTFSNSKKIGLLGYCCKSTHPSYGSDSSLAMVDSDSMFKAIEKLKQEVDFIVLNIHWGDEEIATPKPSDVLLARKLVDCGANLILGHHAHVIQSFEKYKGASIYYGLGNCIFPDFNVMSNYDGSEFTRRYSKIQKKRNRRSLMVTLNEDLSVSHCKLKFEKNTLSYARNSRLRIQFLSEKNWVYNSLKLYCIRKDMVIGILRNPRVVSAKNILYFFTGKR